MTNVPEKCPHCGSTDIGRSHRRFYERLLFGFRPYRCHTCLRRFMMRTPKAAASASRS